MGWYRLIRLSADFPAPPSLGLSAPSESSTADNQRADPQSAETSPCLHFCKMTISTELIQGLLGKTWFTCTLMSPSPVLVLKEGEGKDGGGEGTGVTPHYFLPWQSSSRRAWPHFKEEKKKIYIPLHLLLQTLGSRFRFRFRFRFCSPAETDQTSSPNLNSITNTYLLLFNYYWNEWLFITIIQIIQIAQSSKSSHSCNWNHQMFSQGKSPQPSSKSKFKNLYLSTVNTLSYIPPLFCSILEKLYFKQ